VLTDDLAPLSLPALLAGLEDAHLVKDVASSLVTLARSQPDRAGHVLSELLACLRQRTRRYGATLALVDLGADAVPGAGALIADADADVAQAARQILSKIGTPAFPFLWAAHSDTSAPARREAAREVLRAMPTSVIKDELVTMLNSARPEEITMAMALLLERIHDESLQPAHAGEMVPILLDYVQVNGEERASLRILALLILLGTRITAPALLAALSDNPQGHTKLVHTLLLLDKSVEADLLALVRDTDAPAALRAEIAGILALRTPYREALELAQRLSEVGLWAGRDANNSITSALQPAQLEIALRTLGGLLVGGHWHVQELQRLRTLCKPASAERELFDLLLGWRNGPRIQQLEEQLAIEQDRLRKLVLLHAGEKAEWLGERGELEHQIAAGEQELHHLDQDLKSTTEDMQQRLQRLASENKTLSADVREMQRENQAFAAQAQKAQQERDKFAAELQTLRKYSAQLEQENIVLKRPRSGS
jgi:hypothetical protein